MCVHVVFYAFVVQNIIPGVFICSFNAFREKLRCPLSKTEEKTFNSSALCEQFVHSLMYKFFHYCSFTFLRIINVVCTCVDHDVSKETALKNVLHGHNVPRQEPCVRRKKYHHRALQLLKSIFHTLLPANRAITSDN